MPATLIALKHADAASCGGKAAQLAPLLNHGLPVPTGYCLPFAWYRQAIGDNTDQRAIREALQHWTPDDQQRNALERVIGTLGGRLIARSSASCEADGTPSSGLFVSRMDISDAAKLISAIRAIWGSLWDQPALRLLGHLGVDPQQQAMAVLLQRQIESRHAGLMVTRTTTGDCYVEFVSGRSERLADGRVDPQAMIIRRDREAQTMPKEIPGRLISALSWQIGELDDVHDQPLEIEWADDGSNLWLLQARACPPLTVGRTRLIEGVYRWDREHNPDVLSIAHQSLITLLHAHGAALGYHVHQGRLYRSTSAIESAPPATTPSAPLSALRKRLRAHHPHDDPRTNLERALALFVDFYQDYERWLSAGKNRAQAELAAFISATASELSFAEREMTAEQLASELTTDNLHSGLRIVAELSEIANEPRDQRARSQEDFRRRYGSLVFVWDVSCPTIAEQQDLAELIDRLTDNQTLERFAEQRRRAHQLYVAARQALPDNQRRRFASLVEAARTRRAQQEDDDLLFSDALWIVRRALLAAGEALAADGQIAAPEDVFFLRLERTLTALRRPTQSESCREAVAEGKQAQANHAAAAPALTITHGFAISRPPSSPQARLLCGVGAGGVVRGEVLVVTDAKALMTLDLRNKIVVCPTVLPALAAVLPQVCGLITDHGGLLSHAASLAREFGIPAVVGTQVATSICRSGESVLVDGDNGRVLRLVGGAERGDN